MTDEPGIVDGELIEEMRSLEAIIAFHKKASEKGLETSLFYPDELAGYLNKGLAVTSWNNQHYDTIRREYAAAWVAYYWQRFDEEPFYSVEQLSAFFNR